MFDVFTEEIEVLLKVGSDPVLRKKLQIELIIFGTPVQWSPIFIINNSGTIVN